VGANHFGNENSKEIKMYGMPRQGGGVQVFIVTDKRGQ
jgi:hypothetical protein